MEDGEILEYLYPLPGGGVVHSVDLRHYGREAFSTCMYTEACKSRAEAEALFALIKVQRRAAYQEWQDRQRAWEAQWQADRDFRMATLPARFADFSARLATARARHGLTP